MHVEKKEKRRQRCSRSELKGKTKHTPTSHNVTVASGGFQEAPGQRWTLRAAFTLFTQLSQTPRKLQMHSIDFYLASVFMLNFFLVTLMNGGKRHSDFLLPHRIKLMYSVKKADEVDDRYVRYVPQRNRLYCLLTTPVRIHSDSRFKGKLHCGKKKRTLQDFHDSDPNVSFWHIRVRLRPSDSVWH